MTAFCTSKVLPDDYSWSFSNWLWSNSKLMITVDHFSRALVETSLNGCHVADANVSIKVTWKYDAVFIRIYSSAIYSGMSWNVYIYKFQNSYAKAVDSFHPGNQWSKDDQMTSTLTFVADRMPCWPWRVPRLWWLQGHKWVDSHSCNPQLG